MPTILEPEDVDIWMDPQADEGSLRKILEPKESDLQKYPVSSRVNSTRNNGPELLAPVPPPTLF